MTARFWIAFSVCLLGCQPGGDEEAIHGLLDAQPDVDASPRSDLAGTPVRKLNGIYAMEVVKSTDADLGVGTTWVGNVEATAETSAGSGWTVEFAFDGQGEDYSLSSPLRMGSSGAVMPKNVSGWIADGIDSCIGAPFAITEMTGSKGVGTLRGAELVIARQTTIEAQAGLEYCDVEGPHESAHVLKVVTAFDRPGDWCVSDASCDDSLSCNAASECLPHPSCLLGVCPAVCTGWCE